MPKLPTFKVFDSINVIITLIGLFLGIFPFILQIEELSFKFKMVILVIIVLLSIIIALLRSMYELSKKLKQYQDIISDYYESTSEIAHKHQALANQFQNKSEKLDYSEQHFHLMAQVLANHISLTEPYSKKKENDRYLLLHQLNSEALTKIKEND